MNVMDIEEIRESKQLKNEKCSEAKTAIRDILSDEQREKFDGVFDAAIDKVFRGIMLKDKKRD